MEEADIVRSNRILSHQTTAREQLKHPRLIARLADPLIDTVTTPVDGTVLCRHDRLQRRLILDVARKSWDLGNDDDDLELKLAGADQPF